MPCGAAQVRHFIERLCASQFIPPILLFSVNLVCLFVGLFFVFLYLFLIKNVLVPWTTYVQTKFLPVPDNRT